MEDTAGYSSHTRDFPSITEIEKWVAGQPDAEQLAEIIARSYDYVRKLPLRGLSEHYFDEFSLDDSMD